MDIFDEWATGLGVDPLPDPHNRESWKGLYRAYAGPDVREIKAATMEDPTGYWEGKKYLRACNDLYATEAAIFSAMEARGFEPLEEGEIEKALAD